MDECPCLIPDDDDNCIDCGRHINMPEVAAPPNLGDIPGIVRLIESTAKTYTEMVKDNTDPKNPSLPRLRLIGGYFMRISHKDLYKAILMPSYVSAKGLRLSRHLRALDRDGLRSRTADPNATKSAMIVSWQLKFATAAELAAHVTLNFIQST